MSKAVKLLIFIILILLMFVSYPANAQVNPHQIYTYEQMTKDIAALHEMHPDIITYRSIGQSHQGREIWAVKLGMGIPNIFINGSHHGREWITTNITMYMLDQYAKAYAANQAIGNYNVRDILNKSSIWFVPMVNPDGVTLQQFGLDPFPEELHHTLIKMNNGSRDFKRWKANIVGVDPNRQYPCNWANIKDCPGRPSFASYKGTAPVTEPETISMLEFTYDVLPEIAVSYHSSGRIIFYPDNSPRQDIAREVSRLTGYTQIPLRDPAGGYTDWFVREFNKPAYTPEVSYGVGPTNPPLSIFSEEWQRNKTVGLYLAQEAYSSWHQGFQGSPVVSVYYNDQPIHFPDQQPLLFAGRTFVPVRPFAETIDVPVRWDEGKLYLIQNRQLLKLNYSILNNRAFAPLATIANALDISISFHNGKVWVRKEEDIELQDLHQKTQSKVQNC